MILNLVASSTSSVVINHLFTPSTSNPRLLFCTLVMTPRLSVCGVSCHHLPTLTVAQIRELSLRKAHSSRHRKERNSTKGLWLSMTSPPVSPLPSFPPPGQRRCLVISPSPSRSSLPPLWSASMILEPEGNFLYIGGGYNYSPSATSRRSAGWIASLYLGKGDENQSVVTSTLTTHPIQTMCFHDSDLITGGPYPGLKYYNTSPLGRLPSPPATHSCTEEISSAPTSSSSVFSLKSLPSTSSEGESLLIAGGANPVLDLYAVRGHRAQSLPVVT
jgi:hypothetical protein